MKRHFTRRHLTASVGALVATGLIGVLGVAPTLAHAADAPVVPVPAAPVATPNVVTLPLFGVPLVIDVTSGPGGALTDVSINPADPTWKPSVVRPNKVAFVNDAGTGRIVVKSKNGGQKVEARAGSLADFTGVPGGWSGDVFGNGTNSVVAFSVVDAAGAPDITGVTATGETNVISPTEKSTGGEDHNESYKSARSVIKFTNGIQARSLTIGVVVKTDEDGTTHASLKIALGRIRGLALPADRAAGPHSWTGQLCNGTTAMISYTVAADGTVSGVTSDQPTAVITPNDHGAKVVFDTGEKVSISVRSKTEGGVTTLKISADAKIRCDAKAPTVGGQPVADPSAGKSHHDPKSDQNNGQSGEKQSKNSDKKAEGNSGSNG